LEYPLLLGYPLFRLVSPYNVTSEYAYTHSAQLLIVVKKDCSTDKVTIINPQDIAKSAIVRVYVLLKKIALSGSTIEIFHIIQYFLFIDFKQHHMGWF